MSIRLGIVNFILKRAKVNRMWKLRGEALLNEAKTIQKSKKIIPKSYHNINITKRNDDYLFSPKNVNTKTLVVYLHGGGFIMPIGNYHYRFVAELVRKSQKSFFIVNYPLVPKANVDDILDYVLKNTNQLLKEKDFNELIFMGDSAGAQMSLCMNLYTFVKAQLTKIVAISPVVDMSTLVGSENRLKKKDLILSSEAIEQIFEWCRGEHELSESLVNPMNNSYDNVKILLISGTRDLTNPDTKIFAKKFKENVDYYEYEGLPHIFPFFPLPESKDAKNKILDFL